MRSSEIPSRNALQIVLAPGNFSLRFLRPDRVYRGDLSSPEMEFELEAIGQKLLNHQHHLVNVWLARRIWLSLRVEPIRFGPGRSADKLLWMNRPVELIRSCSVVFVVITSTPLNIGICSRLAGSLGFDRGHFECGIRIPDAIRTGGGGGSGISPGGLGEWRVPGSRPAARPGSTIPAIRVAVPAQLSFIGAVYGGNCRYGRTVPCDRGRDRLDGFDKRLERAFSACHCC